MSSVHIPAFSTSNVTVASPPLVRPWRCPNEVIHRLFPSSSLSTLRHFLLHHAQYHESVIEQPNDTAEYRQLLADTIVVNLQEVAGLYAEAADQQAKLSFAQVGTPFDHISLNHWTAGNPCPKYISPAARQSNSVNPLLTAMGCDSANQVHSKQEGMHSILLRVITRLLKKGPHVSILTQGYAKLDNHRNRSGIGDMYIHNVETNTIVTHLQTQPWNVLLTRTGEELVSWLLFNTAMFSVVNNNCTVQLTGPALVKLNKIVNLAKTYLSKQPSSSNSSIKKRKSNSRKPFFTESEQNPSVPPSTPIPTSNSFNLIPPIAAVAPSSSPISVKRRRSRLQPAKFVPLVTPLPRSTMFYRAPIKSECGLPSSHPFHLCRASKRGALRLINHMFQLSSNSTHATPSPSTTGPTNPTGMLLASPSRTQSLAAQVQFVSPTKPMHQTLLRSQSTPMPVAPVTSLSSSHLALNPRTITNPSPAPHSNLGQSVPSAACALDFLSDNTIPPRQRLAPPQVLALETSLDNSRKAVSTKMKKKRVRVKSDARKAKRFAQLQQRTQNNIESRLTEPPILEATPSPIPPTEAPNAKASPSTPKMDEATSSPGISSPLPILPCSPPPRLRPLLPILQSLLKRHHSTYYGRWLHQCCPWHLPKGVKMPENLQPRVLQKESNPNNQVAATTPEAISMTIDGQALPASAEAKVSTSTRVPAVATAEAAFSPSLSASSTSHTFPSLSSCLSSSYHSRSERNSTVDDDSKQKHYWTQAMDDQSEKEEENFNLKDAPSDRVMASAQSFSITAVSFATASEKFNPPERHMLRAATILSSQEVHSLQSRQSTPSVSTDATAVGLLQGLQTTPASASASQHIGNSSGGVSTLGSISMSQLSKSQRKRARIYRRKQLTNATSIAASSPALRPRAFPHLSSKQTQTPSRRAQDIISRLSKSKGCSSQIPLSELRLETLIKMHTSSSAVISFLRCVCMSVLPVALFGSRHNRERFLQNASLFVRLRRFETMTGIQLMTGMKIKDVPWLQINHTSRQQSRPQARVEPADEPTPFAESIAQSSSNPQQDRKVGQKRKHGATLSDSLQSQEQSFQQNKRPRGESRSAKAFRYPPSHHVTQVRLFSTLLRFLMTDFVLPLLRNNFYATDSEASKHRIVYYRREIWNEIVRKSMYELSGGGHVTEGMPMTSAEDHTSERSMFVRMDKLAALNYLHQRLKDVPSSANQPSIPPAVSLVSANPVPSGSVTQPAASIVAATGAPMAASSSASTLAGHGLGIAKLRLRPRKNGSIRPIVNMARGGTIRVAQQFQADGTIPAVLHYPPINTVLRHVFEVIRYEKDESSPPPNQTKAASTPASSTTTPKATSAATKPRKPSNVLGCSVFGVNAIFNRFQTFSHQWRGLRAIDELAPIPPSHTLTNDGDRSAKRRKRRNRASEQQLFAPLYAVSVDVKHCFDTINRVKLLSIMSSLLSEPSYSLSRYTSLMPLFGVIRPKFLRSVSPACSIPMFLTECIRRSSTQRHVVYTDAVNRRFLDAETILSTLHEHIYQNIVKLGSVLYHQTDGIPQGSVLSSVLCCLYLAHVEKRSILPYLIKSANDAFNKQKTSALKFKRTQSTPAVPTISSAHESVATHSVAKSASIANESHKRPRPAESEVAQLGVERDPKRVKPLTTSATPILSSSMESHPVTVYAPIHLLLRQMDDFLYITTSKEAAMTFHKIMQRGFKQEYGLEINDSKTRVWFGEEHAQMVASASASSSTPLPVVSRTMAWNGFNIDVPTLSISADYTRMHCDAESATNKRRRKDAAAAARAISDESTKESESSELSSSSLQVDPSSLVDSLTIDGCRHSGLNLSKSFRRFLHPKLHPLLLDGNLHSFAIVSQNVFDNFVVSCAKLVVCEKQLQKNAMGTDNQWFTLRTIIDGIEYALHLTHARFRVRNQDEDTTSSINSPNAAATSSSFSSSNPSSLKSRFPLSNVQFRYLALSACALVFRRKQTRFRFVFAILQQLISKFNRAWLVRFENCASNDFPGEEAASKNAKKRTASSVDDANNSSFLHCIQASMYHMFQEYQSQSPRPTGGLFRARASTSPALPRIKLLRNGIVPKPKRRISTASTHGVETEKNQEIKRRESKRTVDETSKSSSQKRRKIGEETFTSDDCAVDFTNISSALVSQRTPKHPRKQVECICGSKLHHLPAASFLDRLQLDDIDHMLPKLSQDAIKLLQAIRF